MDDPYIVGVWALGQGLIRVSFARNGARRRVTLFPGSAEFHSVLRNAIGVGEMVLRVYREKNWSDNDEAAIGVDVQRATAIMKQKCASHRLE